MHPPPQNWETFSLIWASAVNATLLLQPSGGRDAWRGGRKAAAQVCPVVTSVGSQAVVRGLLRVVQCAVEASLNFGVSFFTKFNLIAKYQTALWRSIIVLNYSNVSHSPPKNMF